MLTGRYWILPNGDTISVEKWGTEHANIAKRILLRIGADEGHLAPTHKTFKALTHEERKFFAARGVPKEYLDFFSKNAPDGRMLALRDLGWIRTAQGIFNVQKFDEDTLAAIQGAKEFWNSQSKMDANDSVDINEESTGKMFRVKAKALKYAESVEALKHTGEGVGQWRNPYGRRREKY